MTDRNPPCILHASRTGYHLGTGPEILADIFFYLLLSLSGLSCSVLGECCSVAGVCGVAQEGVTISPSGVHRERGKYRTNVAVPCVSKHCPESFPGSISHSHVFSGDHGPIRLHTRDLPKHVLQSCKPCPPALISASLSVWLLRATIRSFGRARLATAVSSLSSSSCTPSRHASLLSSAQYMYYPCASGLLAID